MPADSYQIWLKELRKKLADAALRAEPLVKAGQFDEAERMVRAVDGDIQGAVTLGELYTRVLAEHVRGANPDRARAEALHERALRWRCASPEAHTAAEAERERAHAEKVRQELGALLESLP